MMIYRRWLLIGLAAVAVLWGCGGEQLIPNDIQKLMADEGGRWALKAVEGHGSIWRWRQRPYAAFDYVELSVARGMDTTITNRRRDTTITPRLDTLANIRDHVILDLKNGYIYSTSKSVSPPIRRGFNGDSVWMVTDTVPVTDSAQLATLQERFNDLEFQFTLPFTLLDTTLSFQLIGETPSIDTTIQKGKEPGTYDTTTTPYTLKQLKVAFPPGKAPVNSGVFYLDDRDGRVRRVLTEKGGAYEMWVWSELEPVIGVQVGGRRVAYPADASGNITGPFDTDMRFYNCDFPRRLDTNPFTWNPEDIVPEVDSTGVTE